MLTAEILSTQLATKKLPQHPTAPVDALLTNIKAQLIHCTSLEALFQVFYRNQHKLTADAQLNFQTMVLDTLVNNDNLKLQLLDWLYSQQDLKRINSFVELIDSPIFSAEYLKLLTCQGTLSHNDSRLIEPLILQYLEAGIVHEQFSESMLESAMLKSIAEDNVAAVKKLIHAGIALERTKDFHFPWLHTCILNNSLNVLNVLILLGIDINKTDSLGRTALHIACAYNRQLHLKHLLAANNICIDVLDHNNESPLMTAVQNESWQCAHTLLQVEPLNCWQQNINGINPVLILILKHQHELLELLLSKSNAGLDDQCLLSAATNNSPQAVKILMQQHQYSQDCIFESFCISIKKNYVQVVQQLLMCDVEINRQNSQGDTLLHIATLEGNLKIIMLLLSQPAIDPSIVNNQGNNVVAIATYRLENLSKNQQLNAAAKMEYQQAQEVLLLLTNLIKRKYL
ncbi:MAG: ankyrin repeat domain-containing protein [Parashewanella sp.]